jgi:hypothetical protein
MIALNGSRGNELWTVDLQAHFGPDEFDIDHGPVVADFDGDGFLDVFLVGGHAEYPAIENNYGRAYAVSVNNGTGPDWPMFRRDIRRSACVIDSISTNIKIAGPDNKIEMNVYPNPGNGKFYLEINGVEGTGLVEVFNVHGMLVYSSILILNDHEVPTKINLHDIDKGMYILSVKVCGYKSLSKVIIR